MMKIYLVKMFRKSTNSSIFLHVDAENRNEAEKYCQRTLKNFECVGSKLCKCPFEPYKEHKGGRLWYSNNNYIFLPYGQINTTILTKEELDNV